MLHSFLSSSQFDYQNSSLGFNSTSTERHSNSSVLNHEKMMIIRMLIWSIVICAISLLSLIVLIIVYTTKQSLRRKLPAKNLVALCIVYCFEYAISILHIVLMLFIVLNETNIVVRVTEFLHFSIELDDETGKFTTNLKSSIVGKLWCISLFTIRHCPNSPGLQSSPTRCIALLLRRISIPTCLWPERKIEKSFFKIC